MVRPALPIHLVYMGETETSIYEGQLVQVLVMSEGTATGILSMHASKS
jgi:hypothetical protein